MDTGAENNQGEKQKNQKPENKDRLAVTAMIVLLVAIIAYAGYEYFWRSLKIRELANQAEVNTTSTSTPKKDINGNKIEGELIAATPEKIKKVDEPLAAQNAGPAILKITKAESVFTVGLVIKSDCQTPASGVSVETARKTASLESLSLNGKTILIKEKRTLVCTYPAGVKEAYLPDPRLDIISVDRAAGKVFFSLIGTENQGSGREIIWQNDFVFDLASQTITQK